MIPSHQPPKADTLTAAVADLLLAIAHRRRQPGPPDDAAGRMADGRTCAPVAAPPARSVSTKRRRRTGAA